MKWIHTLCVLLFCITITSAQTQLTKTPNASPKAKVYQQIGLTDVGIAYFRPAVKDREIWGKLVPYGKVWRAGANDNTVFYCSSELMIGGKSLPAGKYGLHVIPNENEAEVIFSSNYTSWGSFSYNPQEDVLRIKANFTESDHFYEFLTYSFSELGVESATCALSWGNKTISFKVATNVHDQVIASLKNELRYKSGWSWQGWHEAANYCLRNNTHLQQGLNWAARSVFMTPNPANMMTKARLTAKVKGAESEEEKSKAIIASLQSDLDQGNITWKEYNAAANYAASVNNEMAYAWANKAIDMGQSMTAMMTKVQILAKNGKEMEAKKLKEKALDKGSNAELNAYGYKLLFSGKTAEAVEIFEANSRKNATDPNVWDSLGEGYFNNGQKEKAIEAFKKCLSMNPSPTLKSHAKGFLKQLGVDKHSAKS